MKNIEIPKMHFPSQRNSHLFCIENVNFQAIPIIKIVNMIEKQFLIEQMIFIQKICPNLTFFFSSISNQPTTFTIEGQKYLLLFLYENVIL